VGDPGRPLEGEQPVVVAVAGELVALGHYPAGDLGVGAHLAPQGEEGGAHAGLRQRVQDRRRELGAGPVVEGDRRLRGQHPAAADDAAEKRVVGRERGPGQHQ
jgi:hypothetical protein